MPSILKGLSASPEGDVLPHEESTSGIWVRRGGAGALSYLDACCFVGGFERGGDARRSGQVKVRA